MRKSFITCCTSRAPGGYSAFRVYQPGKARVSRAATACGPIAIRVRVRLQPAINGAAADDLRPHAAQHADVEASRRPRRWKQLPVLPESVDWYDELPAAETNWYQCGQQIHRMPPECPSAWLELAVGGVPIAELQSSRARPLYGSSVALPKLAARRRICHDSTRCACNGPRIVHFVFQTNFCCGYR